jgi:hypothetical protein
MKYFIPHHKGLPMHSAGMEIWMLSLHKKEKQKLNRNKQQENERLL